MKKLLGIIILGLLLSGNAYSKIINLHCKYLTGHLTEKIPHPGHTDSKKNTTFIVPAAVIAELIGSFLAQRSNAVWRVELSRESWCWRVVKFPFGTAPWCY